jgi:hypothetical protein
MVMTGPGFPPGSIVMPSKWQPAHHSHGLVVFDIRQGHHGVPYPFVGGGGPPVSFEFLQEDPCQPFHGFAKVAASDSKGPKRSSMVST